jgi:leader peptidase (prepilin peptidase)/N-methyltransferase
MDLLELLGSNGYYLIFAVFLLGLCVGSFLNVVVHRLPRMMEAEWRADCAELDGRAPEPAEPYNLATPRSRCPACAAPITAWQNIPVVSWLVLRGKCANCRVPISPRYPLVELFTGALSAFLAWHYGFNLPLLFALLFAWAMIAASFIDLDTQLLPDSITLPLLWLGLLVNIPGFFVDLTSAVLGAMAGYLVLWGVYWGFKLLANKEGMGFGDFKLLAAIGAWTGWQSIPVALLVSAGLGTVVGLAGIAFAGKDRETRIPFGPYLAIGGLVALLWGRAAVTAWIGSFPR